MSQNDFVVANDTAANVRQDINDALQSLASLSSGPNAPSTTYANMLWYDTGNNILKMRTEADDAWIDVGYLCQSTNKFCIFDDTNVVNSSGTQVGLIGDQPTSDWEAGTSTTESLVSPEKVKAAIEANVTGLGIGQTWQDVTGSRSAGTSYQNTTGNPIGVAIYGVMDKDSGGLQVSTDNSTWVNLGPAGETGRSRAQTFGIVPVNAYYRVENFNSPTIDTWAELR